MKRLTYDFCIAGKHYWLVKGADNLECSEVCRSRDDEGCNGCPIANAFDRLAAIEDILGDDYDINQLKEIVQADREGKVEMFPCKPGEEIWVIERDDYGDALGFSCCVFVAKSENYVIASSHIYQCEGAKEVLKCLNEQTVIEYNCEMLVYPADDCYLDKQSAEAALEKMKEDK